MKRLPIQSSPQTALSSCLAYLRTVSHAGGQLRNVASSLRVERLNKKLAEVGNEYD